MNESNSKFDAELREENSEWGVRKLEDVETEARANNLKLVSNISMPANNLMLVFK